jgi:hypothetical protein
MIFKRLVAYKYTIFGLAVLTALLITWGLFSLRSANADDTLQVPNLIARQQPSATAGDVILPTGTASLLPSTETPTRTPTVTGPALIEARNPDTNVRSGPDISNDRLGQIQPEERYVVLGRRFKWLQIQFPNSPTGIGWVFEDVVNIIGDAALIPEISLEGLPTTDPVIAAQQETLIAATLTPGGVLTLTAASFITPEGLFTTTQSVEEQGRTLAPGEVLPTFTYPPFTNTPPTITNLQPSNGSSSTSGDFAPAIPALGLIGLGLLGLIIGIFRRL